eukprot:71800_1
MMSTPTTDTQSPGPEEIDQNPFFKYLSTSLSRIFTHASQNRYTILVPHSESIRNSIFSEEFAKTHIIHDSPYFKDEYITLDGKCVVVEGGTISTKSGFSGVPRKAKIIRRELFYNDSFESHNVLLISCPLSGPVSKAPARDEVISRVLSTKVEDRSLTDHVDLIRYTLHASQDSLGELFSQLNQAAREFRNSYVLVKGCTRFAAKKIQSTCAKSLEKLLDSVATPLTERQHQEVSIAIETFLISNLHSKLFSELVKLYNDDDQRFADRLQSLHPSVTFTSLGIRKEFRCPQSEAIRLMHQLNVSGRNSALQKLGCIKKISEAICTSVSEENKSSETPGDLALTTDDLLPLMVYVVVHGCPDNILANLEYMEHFHQANSLTAELSFHLATLSAAVTYITDTLTNTSIPSLHSIGRSSPLSKSARHSSVRLQPRLSPRTGSSRPKSAKSLNFDGNGAKLDAFRRESEQLSSRSGHHYSGQSSVSPCSFPPRRNSSERRTHSRAERLHESGRITDSKFSERRRQQTHPSTSLRSNSARNSLKRDSLKRDSAPEVIRFDNESQPITEKKQESWFDKLRKSGDSVTGSIPHR